MDAHEQISEYRSALLLILNSARVMTVVDLPKLLSDIEHAHAVGPMLDPTLYREKMRAMDEDKEILTAALPLWKLAKKLEERARAAESEKAAASG
jgi:hypothetical protein